MHYLLFYDYVEGILEKRAPHREEHLRLAQEAVDRGELVLGGAYADPVDGAEGRGAGSADPSSSTCSKCPERKAKVRFASSRQGSRIGSTPS